MGTHEQSVGATDEWYTPAYVFAALAMRFDLDPAHPLRSDLPIDAWLDTPVSYYSQGGLDWPWSAWETRRRAQAQVWLNPPFGGRNGIVPWLERFMDHSNGIAFVPDRTSAPWWQRFAPQADAILFISPKVKMLDADLQPSKSPAQGTTLLACGAEATLALDRAERAGLGKVWRRP
jgi:DNA N-6-adenine-methyltransferase (Dam)